MKKKLFTTLCFAMAFMTLSASAAKLRVVSYNVACGQWATPEQIAEVLKPLNPDVLLLSEVPKANRGKKVKSWSHRLAEALGLDYVHVGTSSSAGHKAPKWGDMTGDYGGKFKSILSRTPLTEGKEFKPEVVDGHAPALFVLRLKSRGGNSRSILCTCRGTRITRVNQPKSMRGRVQNTKVWRIKSTRKMPYTTSLSEEILMNGPMA